MEDFIAPLTQPQKDQLVGLDQLHSLHRASNDTNFFVNVFGDQQKRFLGKPHAGGNSTCILLNNGKLLAWDGSENATGNDLGDVPAAVFDNPLLLLDAFADGSLFNNFEA